MGWYYCQPTREALVKHLLSTHADHLERLDHAQRGNHLWVLYRLKGTQDTFIVLFKMSGTRGNHHDDYIRWGYKDIEESMGPCEVNCPARILRGSNYQHPIAVAWRQRCERALERERKRKAFVRSLKKGDLLAYFDRVFRYIGPGHTKSLCRAKCPDSMVTYSLKLRYIEPVSDDPVAAIMSKADALLEDQGIKGQYDALRFHLPQSNDLVPYAHDPAILHKRALQFRGAGVVGLLVVAPLTLGDTCFPKVFVARQISHIQALKLADYEDACSKAIRDRVPINGREEWLRQAVQ